MPMHQNSGAPDVPGRKTIYQRMDVEAPVLREEVLNQPSLKECFLFLFTFFFDYDCAVFAFYFYSLFSFIIVLTFALLALYFARVHTRYKRILSKDSLPGWSCREVHR